MFDEGEKMTKLVCPNCNGDIINVRKNADGTRRGTCYICSQVWNIDNAALHADNERLREALESVREGQINLIEFAIVPQRYYDLVHNVIDRINTALNETAVTEP